ncbi:monodechloroaminopyrrolnitrin synthase PrnB family protein [Sphaerisporangium sp. TRM90804]|uniref:monodechloroaminopyrrolnitrin synthase PrnB family protein n=1 Tax=Sphaerisporangium sp. TRM90804 TaxID=3031113 RepID=UPI002448F707|nr:monodechloroaminopyrrolnitrin synthase PrnB family protein [Sphaerisporangium sp. TRM90804]MDH2429482.1 DUF1864 family protein [Sphaerisporangium sp. TRM90804]
MTTLTPHPVRPAPDGAAPLAGRWSGHVPAARVGRADPLGLDPLMARLPGLNRDGDVRAIMGGLTAVVPALEALPGMRTWEVLAAVRDLGMLVASLVRHGLTTADVPPEVETALASSVARTGMVPRETILHYGVWNPADAGRRRTFTGDPSEYALIDCSAAATGPLETAARGLSALVEHGVEPGEQRFETTCLTAARELEHAAAYVRMEHTGLDPVFFTRHLRPYFDPFTVHGVSYHAPAAAHLPLYAVDQAVWAADDTRHPELAELRTDLAAYGLPAWTACHEGLRGEDSLLTRTVRALGSSHVPVTTMVGARALLTTLKAMVAFRGRHRRLVRAAYTDEQRQSQIGSGGVGQDVIDELLSVTRDCAALAGEAIRSAPRPAAAARDHAERRPA